VRCAAVGHSRVASRPVVKKMYICGREWTVKFLPIVIDDEDNLVSGTTNKSALDIEIATKSIPPSEQGSTLLHEIGHAILATVTNKHPDEEELCVQAWETGLVDMMRNERNEWVWEMIRGK